MTFKDATDELFKRTSHSDLAEALGVSVASIRQARLRNDSKAFRDPPKDWRYAVIRIAERRIMEHRELISKLREDM